MDLQTYLQQNFTKVEQTANGGYFCTRSNGDELYIPGNYSGNIGMFAYLPGSGGSGNDARVIRNQIRSANPPDYIVAISAECSDHNNTLQVAYNELSSQGFNITDVAEMSFSASGGIGFDRLEAFQSLHPDVNCVMVVNNTSADGNRTSNPGKYPSLVENEVPIIYVDPPGRGDVQSKTQNGNLNGFNVYWLQSSSGSHIAYNADIIYNHFVDYLLGYNDSFTSTNENGGQVNYQLVTFDTETQQFVNADYNDLVSSYLGRVRIPNMNKILSYDAFNIETQKVENDDMGVLSNLTDLRLTSSTGVVSSDYYYVQTSMNEVRTSVKNSSYLTNLSQLTSRSSDTIPGCIATYVNAFFDIVNNLLSTLAIEAESVLSYAQAMVDMDNDQKAGAEKLGSIVETPYGEDAKPETSYVPQPKTDQVYNPQGTPSGGYPSGGYPSGDTPIGGTPTDDPPAEETPE